MRDFVADRAGHACEYCKMPRAPHFDGFQLEHIVAKRHGGPTVPSNLALACPHCNSHKGTDLAGIYRIGRREILVRLFNPRRHRWSTHFRWAGAKLHGRTRIGKVTIHLLDMNDPGEVFIRAAMTSAGHHFAS